jgi:hypothetical protein
VTGLSAAPSTGPGDAALLFPTAIGSSRNYNVEETKSGFGTLFGIAQISVPRKSAIGGVSASRFAFTSNVADFNAYDQLCAVSNGGGTFYGNDDPSDPPTNQLTPVPELLFPMPRGGSWGRKATELDRHGLPGARALDGEGHQELDSRES